MFNMGFNKEQLKGFGVIGLKVGKFILIEGTKALVLKTAVTAITKGFEDGFGSIKDVTLDDVVGKKKKTPKVDVVDKDHKTDHKRVVVEEVVEEAEKETEQETEEEPVKH
jgi:hypothetical protein